MLQASSVLAHIGTVSKAVPAAMLQVYRRHMEMSRVRGKEGARCNSC